MMKKYRRSVGQIYQQNKIAPSFPQRKNGLIRTNTPKNIDNQSHTKRQYRSNSISQFGKIVTRPTTPKTNSKTKSYRQVGKCYSNTKIKDKSLKKMKSIQIQTQQVLNCLVEQVPTYRIDCKNIYEHKQNNYKANVIKTMNIDKWPKKSNILSVADQNKYTNNLKNTLKSYKPQKPSPLFFSEQKTLISQNHNRNKQNLTQIQKITDSHGVKQFKTQNSHSVVKQEKKQRKNQWRKIEDLSQKQHKMNELADKYRKNMDKYEEHRIILKDLLKNQGIQHGNINMNR